MILFVILFGLAAILLQVGDPAIPQSIILLIPVAGQFITWLAIKMGWGEDQKRNVSAVVAGLMALATMALGTLVLPPLDACSPMSEFNQCAGQVQLFGAAVYGYWLVIWKLQQMIYDMLAGKGVRTPDNAAEDIAKGK